jgi:hypothetical protein
MKGYVYPFFQCVSAANIRSKEHSCCSEDEKRSKGCKKIEGKGGGHGEEEGRGEQSGSKYKKERRHYK